MSRAALSRRRWVVAALVALVVTATPRGKGQQPPVPEEQITFLYYKDLEQADRFFSERLGLTKSLDSEWVKLYRVSSGASLGAVQEGRGFLRTAAEKPVMVSWVVADAKAWFDHLKAQGVKIVKPLGSSNDPPIENFIFEDPSGYTFEILKWRRP